MSRDAGAARQAPGARPRTSRDAGAIPRQARAASPGIAPEAAKPAGRAGLALTALSIAATVATGLAGPSAMEPVLPGRPAGSCLMRVRPPAPGWQDEGHACPLCISGA